MTKVIIDAATRANLHNLDTVLQVCDEDGHTLGYFHPLSDGTPVRSPISDEEIECRRQQRTGKPLAEILERLKRS
jgi:hypothetical protein